MIEAYQIMKKVLSWST